MKSKYWYEREFREMQYRTFDEISLSMEERLLKEYARVYHSVKKDMLLLAKELESKGTVLASDFYKYQKYYELLDKLDKELIGLGSTEKRVIEDGLVDMYNKSLSQTLRKLNVADTNTNKDMVKTIISEVWCSDGKTWKERVNVANFKDELAQALIDATVKGEPSSKIAQQLNAVLNEEYYKTKRLVRTELAHVQNEASIKGYEEAGIEYYTVLCEPDACDDCKALEGQKFKLNEPCVIPRHPFVVARLLQSFDNSRA